MMRSFGRTAEEARPLTLEPGFTQNADGSVLIACGNTKVICTAFMEERVPPFLRNTGKGWVTGEYGMLPGSTHSRTLREAARGRQSGRTVEIARLIGRSLRACVDGALLGERTITVDCDVIQADGGTRTASITGGCLALLLCLWKHHQKFTEPPAVARVAGISLGIHGGQVMVDLDYQEDSGVDVDLNLVMTQDERIIEIQGTAEQAPFTREGLDRIMELGSRTLVGIHQQVKEALLQFGVASEWVP